MNIIKIAVDEKHQCVACPFSIRKNDYMRDSYKCIATHKEIFDCTGMSYEKYIAKFEEIGTPDWCPLVVEDECEWHQVEHDDYSATFLLGCTAKRMALGYSGSLVYVYCPNCGKRIKYVEVE